MILSGLDNRHSLSHVLANTIMVVGKPVQKYSNRFDSIIKTGGLD